MNEVTRIHLGRQAYTISVDAHHSLKKYLSDIESRVGDAEVLKEVELRMSELLVERGVTTDKVILLSDVSYLEEQLGSPASFSEEEEFLDTATINDKTSKRLFRDADGALIGGVAAGLGAYSGIDATLIRLLFILLTIFGGGIGILIYVLFWLLVPAAKTASEKLQMQGKPVTLTALKESVGTVAISNNVRRVNDTVLGVFNTIFRIGIKIIGIGFIMAGIGMFLGIAATVLYMMLHNGRLIQENLFPVGVREDWLLAFAIVDIAVIATFLVLIGIGSFSRKWPVKGWFTAVLAGVFLLSSVVGATLAIDAAPRIRERYETSVHTTTIENVTPFTKVVTNGEVDISYMSSPTYGANLRYVDHPDLTKVKVFVKDGVLYVDSSALDDVKHCTMLCLFPRYNMTVQLYSPNIEDIVTPNPTKVLHPDTTVAPPQPTKPAIELTPQPAAR